MYICALVHADVRMYTCPCPCAYVHTRLRNSSGERCMASSSALDRIHLTSMYTKLAKNGKAYRRDCSSSLFATTVETLVTYQPVMASAAIRASCHPHGSGLSRGLASAIRSCHKCNVYVNGRHAGKSAMAAGLATSSSEDRSSALSSSSEEMTPGTLLACFMPGPSFLKPSHERSNQGVIKCR